MKGCGFQSFKVVYGPPHRQIHKIHHGKVACRWQNYFEISASFYRRLFIYNTMDGGMCSPLRNVNVTGGHN